MEEEGTCAVGWYTEVNGIEAKFDNFSAEVAKDLASVGTFAEDYATLCQTNEIIPCPFWSTVTTGEGDESAVTILKLSNCNVDLSSWRAGLLAMNATGSKIVQLIIHNCELTPAHLDDLLLALDKMGVCQVLKVDFCKIVYPKKVVQEGEGEGEVIAEGESEPQADPKLALLPLLSSNSCSIQYLSLKGMTLGDAFFSSETFIQNIYSNIMLEGLNLSGNHITDEGMKAIFNVLKVSPSIRHLSAVQNDCLGDCLMDLAALLTGAEVTPEEETAFKNIGKLVGDKNKAIKDVNKKRKKAGQPELNEIMAPVERIANVEGVNYIANRALVSIDLSFNPLTAQSFTAATDLLQKQSTEGKISSPALELSLIFRGRASEFVLSKLTTASEADAEEGAAEEGKEASLEETEPSVEGVVFVF